MIVIKSKKCGQIFKLAYKWIFHGKYESTPEGKRWRWSKIIHRTVTLVHKMRLIAVPRNARCFRIQIIYIILWSTVETRSATTTCEHVFCSIKRFFIRVAFHRCEWNGRFGVQPKNQSTHTNQMQWMKQMVTESITQFGEWFEYL